MSSQISYPATYLADHLEGITHDNVWYLLQANRFAPHQVWLAVRHHVLLDAAGCITFDDTVLN